MSLFELFLPLSLILLLLGVFTAWLFALPGVAKYLTNPRAGWILALIPASAFVLLMFATAETNGKAVTFSVPWIPALGLNFSLYLDGLSALFALLITGIGTLVVIYTGYYFDHGPAAKEDSHAHSIEYRFFAYILLFMLAMLGVVLAGDLITLFVFWEGTSISSFLLIAYKFKDEAARKGAFKSLFITGGGGIALLAGFLFIMSISGGADFKTVLSSGDLLRASPLYPVLFTLVALGAFTKSAQFPAHIWLPEAMTAPTPASSFLHSATMVKAGVYLLARLNPALGGTDTWFWTLSIFGLMTMLVGAYLGAKQNDLKPLLAYSTVSQLGVLVALIGQDTEIAFKALVISILAHALYKSALFMSAGIIDHETGTRDLRKLGGLRKQMPVMFGIISIAALSMAGLPPLFGFLAKETLLATATHPSLPELVNVIFPLTTVVAGALILFQAGILVWGVFLAPPADPKHPVHGHDPKWGFWLAPALPALLSLLVGIAPIEPAFLANFLADAAKAAFGAKVKVSLALWTGINVPLVLSIVAVALGLVLFWQRARIRPALMGFLPNLTVNALYDAVLRGLDWGAREATFLQRGQIRFYIGVMLMTAFALVLSFGGVPMGFLKADVLLESPEPNWIFAVLRVIALVIAVGASLVSVLIARDLHAILGFGVSGLAVAAWMALEPAPDVALVQVVVDILITIILVLTLTIIPRKLRRKAQEFTRNSTRIGLMRDGVIALAIGLVVFMVSFASLESRQHPAQASLYYDQNAKALAGAKDIVGAIVVDFRALDTMLEIVVYAFAALGIYTIMHYTVRKAGQSGEVVEQQEAQNPPNEPRGVFGFPTSSFLHMLAYALLPLGIILGLVQVLYGHDQPGDGFTAGVTISLSIASWYIIFGYSAIKSKLTWLRPVRFIWFGLGLALTNALLGLLLGNGQQGRGFFAVVDYGRLLNISSLLPNGIVLSNALIFEISICLVVLGASVLILDNLGHPTEADKESNDLLTEIGQK
ncbi:MAG: hydrogen gas-evolving membrane-bound hydrogenase subunit E [Anaerolineales bacterium]